MPEYNIYGLDQLENQKIGGIVWNIHLEANQSENLAKKITV